MTAPTEAEVRAAIVATAETRYVGESVDPPAGLRSNLGAMARASARTLVESAAYTKELDGVWEDLPEPADGVLWTDLRPSEADRLITLVDEASVRAAERCAAIILAELAAASVAFAAEYPQAPRGTA